jgi:hypothetical protein
MSKKPTFFTLLLLTVGLLYNCSESSSKSGSNSSDGGTHKNTPPECDFTACGVGDADGGDGGDGAGIVGTWTFDSVCIKDPEALIPDAGETPDCYDIFQGVGLKGDGTVTFSDTGTVTGDIELALALNFLVPEECIPTEAKKSTSSSEYCSWLEDGSDSLSGFQGVSCKIKSKDCDCDATSEGLPILNSGFYSVQGENLAQLSGNVPFCVDGDTLRIQIAFSGIPVVVKLTKE